MQDENLPIMACDSEMRSLTMGLTIKGHSKGNRDRIRNEEMLSKKLYFSGSGRSSLLLERMALGVTEYQIHVNS